MNTRINRKLALAAVLTTATAWSLAAPLTPQEAIERLNGASGTLRAPAKSGLQLRRIASDSLGNAAVYLFTPSDGDGFVIASADDLGAPLLGYSDSGTLDPDNMPPAMQWWMAQYARQIALAKEAGAQPFQAEIIQRDEIMPLVSTKWNQNSPFNDECPKYSGENSVTGCLATALAQVVNYHKWPKENGIGTHEYKYNGRKFSFDYENTTFDWDNMIDDYVPGEYTEEQGKAVATLMHAIGVGLDMMYSPNMSGAYSFSVARAIIENLGYDRGAQYLMRDYFTDRDWNDIVYAELAAGRPVVYCGVDPQGGHAFVCDGYSDNGFFHINWGWGGMSDGYYMLSALNPATQGIGGSLLGYGFNYSQDIVAGIMPPAENSDFFIPLYTNGDLYTYPYVDEETGEKADKFTYVDENGYENYVIYYSAMALENVSPALKVVGGDGSETIICQSEMMEIPATSAQNAVGFLGVPFDCSDTGLRPGRYRVSPVCITESGRSNRIISSADAVDFVILEIDEDGNYKLEQPEISDMAQIALNGLSVLFTGNAEVSPTYCLEVENIDSELTFDGSILAEIYGLEISDPDKDSILQSEMIPFRLPAGQKRSVTWIFNPIMEAGEYLVAFRSADGEKTLATYIIDIPDIPKPDLSLENLKLPEQMTFGKTSTISFRVRNNSDIKYEGQVKIRIAREDDGSESFTQTENMTVLPGDYERVTLRLKPTAETFGSEGSFIISFIDKWGRSIGNDRKVGITAGIASILAGDDVTADVYNLQGILIRHNAGISEINTLPGGIYVVRTAKGCYKISI